MAAIFRDFAAAAVVLTRKRAVPLAMMTKKIDENRLACFLFFLYEYGAPLDKFYYLRISAF